MTEEDRAFFQWERKIFGSNPIPEWGVVKAMYAEHLLATKTKTQIWKMLCGPSKGPCHCNCLCAPGLAWNALLEKEQQETK